MEESQFDFNAHKLKAIQDYQRIKPLYDSFAQTVKEILSNSISEKRIKVASIEARAKSIESFGNKSISQSEIDPSEPKYLNPLNDITDLAGVRVITFFPNSIEDIDADIINQFDVLERINKTDILMKTDKLGYQSIHYIASLKHNRRNLPEYSRYTELKVEIQVRTILQHAWAEIEHDIQYKSEETIPTTIKRRFIALAGLLEIADREFQAIQNDDIKLRQEARNFVEKGNFSKVEITGDALKAYLDKKLGSDGRMTEGSYDWYAKMLKGYGFQNIQQLDECLSPYDHDQLSRKIAGGKQGQLTRFEYMLHAGLGDNFTIGHPLRKYNWWIEWKEKDSKKIVDEGFPYGGYILNEDQLNKFDNMDKSQSAAAESQIKL